MGRRPGILAGGVGAQTRWTARAQNSLARRRKRRLKMKFISSSIVKTGSSSLTDAVTYPTNLAIAGANASLIDDATGNGEFVFTALMPGTYKSVSSRPVPT